MTAAGWAFGLCAGYVLGPLLLQVGAATGVSEKDLAMRLVSVVVLFPVLFIGFWIYEKKKQRQILPNSPGAATATESNHSTSQESSPVVEPGSQTRTPSKWNYVAIAVALFMLVFLFVPKIVSGQLANQYYLGAAFWVGVLIYCTLNLKRSKAKA